MKNWTPLHWAANFLKNSNEIIELLISKGADINAKDIVYLNIIILFLITFIENKERKFNMKNQTPLLGTHK